MLLIESDIVYCIFWVDSFFPFRWIRAEYTKWHVLQMIHLLTALRIFPSAGTYDIIKTVMFYISVRIRKEIVQVINQPIFFRARIPLA